MGKQTTTGKTSKIGVLIPQFPGQTHIFFWREIMAMEAMGVDVALFSTRLPPQGLISHEWSDQAIARTTYLGRIRPFAAVAAIVMLPWRKIWSDVLRQRGLLKDILICAASARQLMQASHMHGIEHVHVHSCARAALTATLSRLLGGPEYSVTLHGPMSDYGIGQALKWRHAAFATIITEKLLAEAKSELGTDFPASVRVQPMGVETDILKRTTPYTPPKKAATVKLFSCARLNVVKGHQDLMQAVYLLRKQGYKIELVIAGEDDDGGNGYHLELDKRIHELNLGDCVKMLGAISSEKVKEHLLSADIFVLASWHEPLGVAYMEAMSCGVPTIGTNAGGVPELINHGQDGILVEPKNPVVLAESIRELIDNPSLCQKLSTNGRDRIEKGFHSGIGAETILSMTDEKVD